MRLQGDAEPKPARSLATEGEARVSAEEMQGAQLALAQARDRQWRDERQAKLQAQLDRARYLEAMGMRLGTFALTGAVFLFVAGFFVVGFAGLRDVLAIGISIAIPVVLLLLACVLLYAGKGRQAIVLAHGRRWEIELDQESDPSPQ